MYCVIFGLKVRGLVGKDLKDADNEVEEGCNAPFFLIEFRDEDGFAGAGGIQPVYQSMMHKGDKVGLSRAPRADQEKVVFLRALYGLHEAGQNVFHDLVTAYEKSFQGFPAHVSGAVAGIFKEALFHARISRHHFFTSCQRKS